MVAVLGFGKQEILHAVQDMYTIVADQPDTPLHFPIGPDACRLAGYTDEQMSSLPPDTLASFAGVGCPFRADVIKPGDVVLDVGSGSGTDVLLAAEMVGENGKVWALDLTQAMRDKLQRTLDKAHVANVEVIAGEAERIPLPDASVDVVTSNGVLNLVPDKRRAIAEIYRVLKPGGRVQVADIVIANPVTPDCEDDPKLWAECVVGATVDESYLNMFRDAGFKDVEVLRDYDYFAYSPSEETKEVARQFGAHAFELRMKRAEKAPARILQYARRLDPRRLVKAVQRRGLWGTASLLTAILACYGTLALVALMSLIGVSMAVNETTWAGSIMLFALLAGVVIVLGWRKHQSLKPLVPGLAGVAVLIYTMVVNYSVVTEVVGFVLLGIAVYLDYDLRRWSRVAEKRRKLKRRTGGRGESPRQRPAA
jgi:ubiquinone/menaquinone biosynthesis C-methylase UbiE